MKEILQKTLKRLNYLVNEQFKKLPYKSPVAYREKKRPLQSRGREYTEQEKNNLYQYHYPLIRRRQEKHF